MARIRTVKPELWTDEDFIDLSMPARLMFIASLNFADDYGVLADKPRTLAARCLPFDAVDAIEVVDELVDAEFYVRCQSPDGSKVLVIRTFAQHQKIDKRTKGRWGDPAEWDSGTIHDKEPPIPPHPAESPQLPPENAHGMEGNGRDQEGNGMDRSIVVDDPTEPAPIPKDDVKARRSSIIRAEAEARTDQQESVVSRGPYIAKVIREVSRDFGPTIEQALTKHPDAPDWAIADRVFREDFSVNLSDWDESDEAA